MNDDTCPACDRPMSYPTSCHCTFERRVFALAAGADEFGPLDRTTLVALNRAMRALDQSDLWPIRGRFNATDRAIARVRREDTDLAPLEYVLAVDGEVSRIVNNPRTL